jgi:hypothetical protein
MHRASEQSVLTGNLSGGLSASIRRPGECRNLRVAHSVGDQNLLPLAIVRYCMSIAQHR